eukprot:TRINITY_DN2396_c0_g1_i2.p1 TRINITY_DN2396_c0_g1~~TRINITY_DN2396_c0_g1_i2.p1  ORF type:complete len:312 (-),score=32.60 TRINITY_DN2396_c0_g1_i2:17-952(-)
MLPHKKEVPLNLGQQLSPLAKSTLSVITPSLWWFTKHYKSDTLPHKRTLRLFVWYSQAVSLYGFRNLYLHMIKNIGVSRTFPKSLERFSFLGSLIYTISLWRTVNTWIGGTYFTFNLVYLAFFGYILWLSTMYNKGLPDPTEKRERGVIHWPSLVGFVGLNAAASAAYGNELKTVLLSGDKYTFLEMVGYMVNNFGILSAGFKTSKTSVPAIAPFSAVSPLAVAYTFVTLAQLPYVKDSQMSRVYVAGNIVTIYSLVVISYFCLLAERAKLTRKSVTKTAKERAGKKLFKPRLPITPFGTTKLKRTTKSKL